MSEKAQTQQVSETGTRRRSWRRWVVGGVAVVVVLAGVCSWWVVGRRVWTDGRGIRVGDRDARLRQVLWNRPAAVDGALNSGAHEYEPALSPDGAEMYFVRGKPGGSADVLVSYRKANAWTEPVALAAVNTSADELGPRVSADGRFLFFYSDRAGGFGGYDLWVSERAGEGWGTPVNLGASVNGPFNEYSPAPSPDGKRLFFASNRAAAARVGSKEAWRATIREAELGDYDLMVAEVTEGGAPATTQATTRPSGQLVLSNAVELKGVNSTAHDGACDVSPGGDFIYFASNRPGGFGKFDLYRGRLFGDRVTDVENLGPPVNTPDNEADPQLAMAGFRLVFSSDRRGSTDGGYDLFTADSREVFAAREGRGLPSLGWSWWVLLLSLLLLLPLIWMFRGLDDRKLTLLQRCILLSLLLHVLLGLLFGVVGVTHRVMEFVKGPDRGGMEIAGNLDQSREIVVGEMIRNQASDVPAPAASVAELAKADLKVERTEAPAPMPVEVPRAKADASPTRVEVETPKASPPQKVEPLAFSQPAVSPTLPEVKIETSEGRTVAENTPAAAAPQVNDARPAQAELPRVEPARVQVQATPVAPKAESLAPAVAPAGESVAKVPVQNEAVTPQVQTAQAAAPQVTGPEFRPQQVAAAEPSSPRIAQASVGVSRTATTAPAPTTRPVNADLSTPAVAVNPEPLRVAAAPSTPVAAAVPAPKVDGVAMPAAAPMAAAPDVSPPKMSAPVAVAPAAEERLAKATFPAPPAIAPQPIAPREIGPASAVPAPSFSPEKLPGAVSPVQAPVSVEKAAGPAVPVAAPNLAAAGIPPVKLGRVGPTTPATPLAGALGPVGPTAADALMRRALEARTPVIEDLGGSKESELAVARALAYLARNQEDDGRWTKYMRNRTPGGRDRHDVAYTALAALCFLGADHTPAKDGPYREAVTKALDYVLSVQEADGDLRSGGDMYDQGIAAIALAEAAQMTKDQRYKRAALRACDFIVRAQNPEHGGWRYQPRADGDTSVLGWQVMALHGAEALGYDIPQRTRTGAGRWLRRVSNGAHGGLAGYTNNKPRKSMTAEALFSRILLGQDLEEETIDEASAYLIQDSPASAPVDHYTWYYTSLALMQLQNDAWQKWNGQLRDHLVKLQRRSGELEGSWDMDPNYGQRGGRVYSTVLSTLTLEVYYRYLPMYSKAAVKKDEGR